VLWSSFTARRRLDGFDLFDFSFQKLTPSLFEVFQGTA